MQVINWFEFQHLLADVDTLNAQPREVLTFTIQALCAAGPRKVASRTDIFQRTYSPNPRHLSYTLCFAAGKERGFIQ